MQVTPQAQPTPIDSKVLEKALDSAKMQMIVGSGKKDNTFIIGVLMQLKTRFTEEIPTAATDGLNILFNPHFFMSLGEEERIFLILHEVWHVALMHTCPSRKTGKEPVKWNYAGDYVINLMIADQGYPIPKGGLLDHQYRDMTTEQVYNVLPEIEQPDESLLDVNDAGDLQSESTKQGSESNSAKAGQQDPKKLEEEIENIIQQAALKAEALKAVGSIPSEVGIMLDELRNPKLPWHALLKRYLRDKAKSKTSYKKLKRRYQPNLIMPQKTKRGLSHLAFAVDASSSVSDEEFSHILSEINEIRRLFSPKKMTILEFNTKIADIYELDKRDNVYNIEFTARGGTCVEDVLQWGVDNQPNAMLIFSDGWFHHPRDPDMYPENLFWIIHNYPEFTAQHGKVVHYEVNL